MMKKLILLVALLIFPLAQSFAQDVTPNAESAATAEAGVATIKTYLLERVGELFSHAETLQADAQAYFGLIEAAGFDYQQAWDENQAEITELVEHARSEWFAADSNYELAEGIVAGVPSLAHFDVWIDAGPPASEDPENAYDWTLTLDDGRTFEKPGSILQWLLETSLYGTIPDRVGLQVDFDGNGQTERGDALPEAYFLLGSANALVDAATQLNDASNAWTPTLEDSFTALLTMIPTMGDYFQEWKASTIEGIDPRFVAKSRLVDVHGIATSLEVVYNNVSPDVVAVDATLDQQITAGFDDLLSFLEDTHQQELDGTQFTAEQADALGEQAQVKADSLAALAGQAASLLNLTLSLE